MRVKLSKYNIIRKINEKKYLLFNSFTGAIVLIDNNEYEKFLYCSGAIERDSFLKDMYCNGFLVSENIDEDSIIDLNRKRSIYGIGQDEAIFVIAPTLCCNAKCFYCFEYDSKTGIMTDDVLNETYLFITNEAKNKTKIILNWFGGEPLIAYEKVMKLGGMIKEFCNSNNIVYECKMFTNGLLLTKNRVKSMKECIALKKVQITFDGFRDYHNKVKNFGIETSAFDVIIENINYLIDENIKVVIRINISKENESSVKGLINYLVSFDKIKSNAFIYFYPLVNYTNTDDDRFLNIVEYEKYLSKYYNMLYEVGYYVTYNQISFKPLESSCGLLKINNYAIDDCGYLYKCDHVLGDVKYSIGNVKDGVFINNNYMNKLDANINEECYNCSLLPQCQGGCLFVRKSNHPFASHCNMIKYNHSVLLDIVIKLI